MNTLKEIAQAIKNLKSAVIFTHMRPDGDTIGCGMALSRALDLCGVQNEIVNEGEIPDRFAFLSDIGKFKRIPSIDAEGFITVDSSDEMRLGQLQDYYFKHAAGKITVNVDHHVSNTRFAKYNFVRNRASNAENVLELIKELGVAVDKQIAEYLLTGMFTDSGAFSHDDVNGDTFRAAGEMADAGADVNRIHYECMKKQSRTRAEFYLHVLSKLRYLLDGRLAVAMVTAEALEAYKLKSDATEGIVDFGLTVDGTEVSVCLLEVGKGQYKASFRSKGSVNVNEVANVFGGGGHVLASGCMLFGEPEEVVDKIRYAVYQRLE